MSIVITTPTGNIGRRVTQLVIQAGVRPTIIVRDPAKLDPEVVDRSNVIVADLTDSEAIIQATKGAQSLFWLNPPSFTEPNPVGRYHSFGKIAASAVKANGIARVVFLSSTSGPQAAGESAGLIDGLRLSEEELNATGAHITHLRPGFFYENILLQLDAIRHTNAFYLPLGKDVKAPYVGTRDIAEIAAARLLDQTWTGRTIQPIVGSGNLTPTEVAQQLSDGIGQTVNFVQVSPDDVRATLSAAGASSGFIEGYIQMFASFSDATSHEEQSGILSKTPTSLRSWAFDVLRPLINVPALV